MNAGSTQIVAHAVCPDSQPHRHTYTHTFTVALEKQREGTADNWQLLFQEQVFVFMSIKETRVQLNEANEKAPHLALVVQQSVSGRAKHTAHTHNDVLLNTG